MNSSQSSEPERGDPGHEAGLSAQFAGLVMQQTNLALMLLGKSPHPEAQKTMLDLEGAKMFIDQLEMLEVKTRGNLSPDEAKLLKQSLTALRMAFVQAIDSPSSTTAAPKESPPSTAPTRAAESSVPPEQASTSQSEDDTRKKFSKKY